MIIIVNANPAASPDKPGKHDIAHIASSVS